MKTGGDGSSPLFKYRALKCIAVISIGAAAWTSAAQPGNDNFADSFLISESSITVTGTLSNASSEIGEAIIAGISSGQTAWWTWLAPSNGIVEIFLSGSGFNPFAAVYTGSELETLNLVATNSYVSCYENESCGCHLRTRQQMTFHVAQGETYRISVDSALLTDSTPPPSMIFPIGEVYVAPQATRTTNVMAGGPIQFVLQFSPAPGNDDLAHAINLVGNRTRASASNKGATSEPGEPLHLGNSGGSSVWYSWTAPASGRVTVSTNNMPPYEPPGWSGYVGVTHISLYGVSDHVPTCGNEIDQNPPPLFFPVFAAYTGASVESLVSVHAVALALEAYPHAVGFDAVKGETYRIAFDGNKGTTGDVPLFLALTKPASNDAFKKRIATRGIYVVASGFNAGATRESGEALFTPNTFGKSVWWSWTAPVSGTVNIHLGASDRPFPVGVFSGSTLTNLSLISAGTGSTSFEAVAGQTYQIAVSDFDGVTGAIVFHLQAPVVEAELRSVIASRSRALLSYTALKGQKLLLQKSSNGLSWQNVRTALARSSGTTFSVNQPPAQAGPFYRAIIVDYRP
jgi:hypothetical protein